MTDALVNLDAERDVLGALIAFDTGWDDVVGILDPEDFYRGSHRTLYETLRDMHAANRPIDGVTVTDELARLGHLEGVGVGEIASMVNHAPSWVTLKHHAGIVADYGRRRDVVERAGALLRAAGDLQRDISATLHDHAVRLTAIPATAELPILANHELDQLPEPKWVVDGHVPEGLTAMYGASGSGKSFCALDWALCLVSGTDWFGHRVDRRRVLYVAGEGAAGIKVRRDAWIAERHADVSGLHVLGQALNLLDGRNAALLVQAVRRHRLGLVVLDTLNRTMGGDENSTEDMSAYVAACTQVIAAGASVIVVHHTGVDRSRMRGNTALYAACDAVVGVEREEDSTDVTLLNDYPRGKQKDAEPFPPKQLRMVEHAGSMVLRDRWGGPKTYARRIDSISVPMSRLTVAQHLGVPPREVDTLVASGRLVKVTGGVVADVYSANYSQEAAF